MLLLIADLEKIRYTVGYRLLCNQINSRDLLIDDIRVNSATVIHYHDAPYTLVETIDSL